MNLPLASIGPWQLTLIVVIACSFIIPIIALIDVLRKEFKGNDKLIWVLVILLFNIIGSLLYFIFGSNKAIKK